MTTIATSSVVPREAISTPCVLRSITLPWTAIIRDAAYDYCYGFEFQTARMIRSHNFAFSRRDAPEFCP